MRGGECDGPGQRGNPQVYRVKSSVGALQTALNTTPGKHLSSQAIESVRNSPAQTLHTCAHHTVGQLFLGLLPQHVSLQDVVLKRKVEGGN